MQRLIRFRTSVDLQMRKNHPCIAFRKLYFRHANKRDVNVQQHATFVVTQLKIMPMLQ